MLFARGFEIVGREGETDNLHLAGMSAALAQFGARANGAAVALFAIFGHGVARGDAGNLLLPRDFQTSLLTGAPEVLRRVTLADAELLRMLGSSGAERGIAVFDACRQEAEPVTRPPPHS